MNQQVYKAILGALGVIGGAFSKDARIGVPVALASALVAGLAIYEEWEAKKVPTFRVGEAAKKPESQAPMTLSIPSGHVVKIEGRGEIVPHF